MISFPRLALLWFVFIPWASGQQEEWERTPQSAADLEKIQTRLQTLLPAAKRVTVVVLGDGSGSGVIVSRDGLVLTAGHVCGKAGTKLRVILSDGRVVGAESLGSVKTTDAGVVRLASGRYPFAAMAAADRSLALGTWCFALGYPGGWDRERGPVVRMGRLISRAKRALRSDCKLVGGDSGGPLFDLQGRVVAIHSWISRHPDQNFHVPIATYRQHWPELVRPQVAAVPSSKPRGQASL